MAIKNASRSAGQKGSGSCECKVMAGRKRRPSTRSEIVSRGGNGMQHSSFLEKVLNEKKRDHSTEIRSEQGTDKWQRKEKTGGYCGGVGGKLYCARGL